jgi:hypothetical protein
LFERLRRPPLRLAAVEVDAQMAVGRTLERVSSTELLRFRGQESVQEFAPPGTREVPGTVYCVRTYRIPAEAGHVYLPAAKDGGPMPRKQHHLEIL